MLTVVLHTVDIGILSCRVSSIVANKYHRLLFVAGLGRIKYSVVSAALTHPIGKMEPYLRHYTQRIFAANIVQIIVKLYSA